MPPSPPPLTIRVYQVREMHCASCVQRIERTLQALPAVRQAQVNLAAGTVRVTLKQSTPQADAMVIAALAAAGYPAQAMPDPEAPSRTANPPDPLVREGRICLLTLVLAAPLLLPMALMPLGVHVMLPMAVQWVLASLVQWGAGARFYRGAWHAVRHAQGNMALLVALGTTAAWGLSTWRWLSTPAGAPSPEVYFESGAVVIALVRLGQYLEGRAKRQTSAALRALQALRPAMARRLTDQTETLVPLAEIQVGDQLAILPGERIPLDGHVLSGHSQVDTALITGEPLPHDVAPGARLVGGSLNTYGRLVCQVDAIGADTMLAQIIRMVDDAQSAKAPIQQAVDRIAAWFVPIVLLIALGTGLVWWSSGQSGATALMHAVAVLVIACPCALGLATPAALMVGTGVAARHGILIRDAQALEHGHHIQTVAWDKTGTLTEGQPRLLAILTAPGHDAPTLLRHAAAVQQGSEHVLARAVLAALPPDHPPLPAAQAITALPGRGVVGQIADETWTLGNHHILSDYAVPHDPKSALVVAAQAEQQRGHTVSWVVCSRPGQVPELLGALVFGDAIRAQAAPAIEALHARGLSCLMLSGDQEPAAAWVARQVGLTRWTAGLLPADKAHYIASLQRTAPGTIAMVGDGINDAPALAAADLGIALASGTDVAVHTAGIVLMRPDPTLVGAALDIAHRTVIKIRQNLFWAFAYNVLAIPLAAMGQLAPPIAAAAMALSSVSVLLNALRLQRWRPPAVSHPRHGPAPATPAP